MKKVKNRLIAILFLFLLNLSSSIFSNNVKNFTSNSIIQEFNSPKLSFSNKSLLHSFDFEDGIIGQDPSGVPLSVNEPAGCTANIETLGDGQQKHVALYKSGSVGRVMLRDNISYYGDNYEVGEIHFKFYHDTSLFGIWIRDSGGILFRIDFWSGNVGRWDPYGIITSYTLNQWTNITIYYNISKGWMFDLNSIRFGGDYSYNFDYGGSIGITHLEWVSAISGGGDGYFRIDDIAFYYENDNPIKIYSPEAKDYKGAMDGYYPATYGFENDEYGEQAQGWWTENEAGCDSQIIETYKGHNDVYELYDNSGSAKADVINNFENKTYGTIELWFQLGTSDYHAGIVVGFREPYKSKISFQIGPGTNLLARNGSVLIAMPEFGIIKNNSWYHLRFDFRAEGAPYYMGLSEDSYMMYLNGTKANSELLCNPLESSFPFNSLQFSTGGGFSPDYLVYFDAIGYSWDPNYNIGDNLYEGLLLSFENNTNLDWIGYSLDNQQNRTILGNTTIPMPEDGIHNIQVFGENLGTTYQSDKRYFTVDFPIDIINPEEKAYSEPMSGYYPGTYGFEDVLDDTTPTYVEYDTFGTSPDWVNSYTRVINNKIDGAGNKHNKVLLLKDATSSALALSYLNFTDYGSEIARNSALEFYHLLDIPGTHYISRIAFAGNYGDLFQIFFETNTLEIKYINSSGSYSTGLNLVRDRWYRYSIDISCDGGYAGLSANQFRFRIYDDKGILIYTSYDMDFINSHPTGGPNRIKMVSSETQTQEYQYLDAFSITGLQDNYAIGDNLNEGLLLSFENNTIFNWTGYSLDGSANRTILGNSTIPLPNDGSHFIRVFGNDAFGTVYESNIRRFSVHHITIDTPEDKIYTVPMSGYYPATYGFENDMEGSIANSWTDESSTGEWVRVDAGISGHNKTLKFYDAQGAADQLALASLPFSSQTNGTIEFWVYKLSSGGSSYFSCVTQSGDVFNDALTRATGMAGDQNNDGNFTISDGSDYAQTVDNFTRDEWHHIRIDFECGSGSYKGLAPDTYDVYFDQVLVKDDADFYDNNDLTSIDHLFFMTSQTFLGIFYIDAVGLSWDPKYNIGDNLNEGLLLSFENSTALDWTGYSLDYQPVKTIFGNTTFPLLENGLHTIQVFGNDSLGRNYNSEMRHFEIDYHPIKIITPENKTYTEPMSGYYPATFGFENDVVGEQEPEAFNNLFSSSCTGIVISEIDGHKNVIKVNDTNIAGSACIMQRFNEGGFQNQTHGTVEYWLRVTSIDYNTEFRLNWGYGINDAAIVLRIIGSTGQWQYNDGIWNQVPNIPSPSADTWHHIRIDFRCSGAPSYLGLSENHFNMSINGVFSGSLPFATASSDIAMFNPIYTASGDYGLTNAYCDAIGYSWIPNYDLGDNMNEGLLLSFENSTALDWIGYSLDGQVNKTIMGNTTINMPSEGVHTIQVFGNDSLGTIYQSELRYFTINTSQISIDLISPEIIINSPIYNDLFGSTPLSYNITIIELNLDTMWYTLDGGVTNTTITEPTGIIEQAIWNNRPNGTVTIGFYADDVTGNIGFEAVVVRKDIFPPVIVINSPSQNQVFRDTPPSFELSITDGNLDSIWYTLDDGIINFTCNVAGAVNPTYWAAIPPGDYTLKFFANDILGNIGSSEVIVKKREPAIPGYNPILLGLIIAVGIIYIMQRINKKLH